MIGSQPISTVQFAAATASVDDILRSTYPNTTVFDFLDTILTTPTGLITTFFPSQSASVAVGEMFVFANGVPDPAVKVIYPCTPDGVKFPPPSVVPVLSFATNS